ncbi:hypothetical protein [Heyndrickxia acidicola]|uniref:Uncharacterized protein n=1 Tax=Heyndrickxia acidicola TaxID=209389 RepID=A0ABU6MID0_9BACI|nr:hypothetical protein [Heyndrickxia acidicola]MED1203012.1 hypothetical protein [Heyndrickxia acidicola]
MSEITRLDEETQADVISKAFYGSESHGATDVRLLREGWVKEDHAGAQRREGS